MKKNVKGGLFGAFMIICCLAFQSFAYVDCYQQFSTDFDTAQKAYEADVRKCRFAWPPGMCMPEAELSYDKSIGRAVSIYEGCIDNKK